MGTLIKASSSLPFLFEPTYYDDRMLMDGGTIWNIDITGAIERCLNEVVDDEQHIIMDIEITEFLHDFDSIEETGKTLSNFERRRQIKQFYDVMDDIIE